MTAVFRLSISCSQLFYHFLHLSFHSILIDEHVVEIYCLFVTHLNALGFLDQVLAQAWHGRLGIGWGRLSSSFMVTCYTSKAFSPLLPRTNSLQYWKVNPRPHTCHSTTELCLLTIFCFLCWDEVSLSYPDWLWIHCSWGKLEFRSSYLNLLSG